MHNLYAWLIIIIFSLSTLFAQTTLSEKRPPKTKNKGTYQRYESNDMGLFRQHPNFVKPILKEQEVILKVEDTLNRFRKVEVFFKNNNPYFVDVNPNVTKLSQKRPKPVLASNEPVVAETPPPSVATSVISRPKKSTPIKARGYRIQLFNGQDREQANRVKNQFIALFPDVPRYLVFVEPTYRVRVGDFYTKGDADTFLQNLKKISAFSDAIVIRDIVEFREQEPEEEVVTPEN